MSERSGERVGCVVITYNSEDVLGSFLHSIVRTNGVTDVVVVDSASDHPEQLERIATEYGATFIRSAANIGYGRSANLGAASFPAEVTAVMVCNPDLVAHEDAVRILSEHLAADPAVGVAGPTILNPDETVYPSARRSPTVGVGVGHALFVKVWPTNPWTRRYRNADIDRTQPSASEWVSGACMLFRRNAFDSVGGFNPAYFMYFEDVDVCLRLSRAGWRCDYVPAARVTHTGAHSTSGESQQMARVHHDSARTFLATLLPGKRNALARGVLGIGLSARSRFGT